MTCRRSKLDSTSATVLRLKELLRAMVVNDGQHTPSSFALSASASNTSFVVELMSCISHTAHINLMLTQPSNA
jgi:hypothetical protein